MAISLEQEIKAGYERGWSFVQLVGKRPTEQGWSSRARETLEDALAWARHGNVGLRTGRASGVVVIDVDGGEIPSDLPATVTARTGRCGFHLYYRAPDRQTRNRVRYRPNCDVRADGGQVVFVGSIHPDTGRPYEWVSGFGPDEIDFAAMPELPELELPEPASQPTPQAADKYVNAALRRECDAVRAAPKGTRNHTLNKAAYSLGGLNIPEAEIVAALTQASTLPHHETQATIRSGLDAGRARPRSVPPATSTPATFGDQISIASRYILTPGQHVTADGEVIEQSTGEFARQALAAIPPGEIYRRFGIAGHLEGPDGQRSFSKIDNALMRQVIDRHAKLGQWVKKRDSDEQVIVYRATSNDNASLVVGLANISPMVQAIDLIVPYPIYDANWRRVPPGWHDGIFYDESPDNANIDPETDLRLITEILTDLVIDFPFADVASLHNFYGMLLTPLVRVAVGGNVPMHLVVASKARTGKSKLVELVWGITIAGRPLPAMQFTGTDEEREKRITAMLLVGNTLAYLDNLNELDSAALAMILTSQTHYGRILGASKMARSHNSLIFAGTGNNVKLSGEIAKRTVAIQLQPTTHDPENRNDFLHPDLERYLRDKRRAVLCCLMGMIELWKEAGSPESQRPMGGFEGWSRAVGGILDVCGFTEWRTNERRFRSSADQEEQDLEALVQLWFERWGSNPVKGADIAALAKQQGLFPGVFNGRSDRGETTAFGRSVLAKNVNTPIGTAVIRRCGTASNATYALERH